MAVSVCMDFETDVNYLCQDEAGPPAHKLKLICLIKIEDSNRSASTARKYCNLKKAKPSPWAVRLSFHKFPAVNQDNQVRENPDMRKQGLLRRRFIAALFYRTFPTYLGFILYKNAEVSDMA
jgi:hypothetical protein